MAYILAQQKYSNVLATHALRNICKNLQFISRAWILSINTNCCERRRSLLFGTQCNLRIWLAANMRYIRIESRFSGCKVWYILILQKHKRNPSHESMIKCNTLKCISRVNENHSKCIHSNTNLLFSLYIKSTNTLNEKIEQYCYYN